MSSPHDAFFKSLFSDTAELVHLLRDLLHPEVVRLLDLDAVEPLPTEVVRESLRIGLSDLRFHVPWRAGGHLALRVLLEHQSTVDPAMPLRALRYILDVWSTPPRTDHKLPVALTLILFHGPRPWSAARALSELYDAPPGALPFLAPYLPELRLRLIDLAATDEDAIPGQGAGKLGLLLMRDAHKPDLWPTLHRRVDLWVEGYRQHGPSTMAKTLRYIYEVTDPELPAELKAKLISLVHPKDQEVLMSAAERLRQEGRVEGRIEGRIEGELRAKREFTLKMLTRRFGPSSDAVAARVMAADLDTLERLTDGLLSAPSLDALLASAG
ncbi:Rpn family recombination-promoting nuclease/putative transposase [Myxococcota bacterium]|nr:Rpn family recombination-promoting nuclease/putative transposase [Myxococcota bacterium]